MIARPLWLALVLACFSLVDSASGYPLDAADRTGMTRLEAYRLAQTGRVRA